MNDPELWAQAITRVLDAAAAHGLGARGIATSPLRGASAGNREFLVWLQPGPADLPAEALQNALATDGSAP